MPRLFTCDHCGGTFPQHPAQTDQDQRAERQRLWGGPPEPDDAKVCDNCFEILLRTLKG